MASAREREEQFLRIVADYHDLVAKVCYVSSGPDAPFDDLYQEVLTNVWEGLPAFRGDSKLSTWLYRTAINTCLTWHRRNSRHSRNRISLENMVSEPAAGADNSEFLQELRELHRLISRLEPLEKAIITMWLDEKSYDEISEVTGLTCNNIAVRMHRIKNKLSQMANGIK